MSRPQEPEFLIQWREYVKKGPPKCCHTRDYYDKTGHCENFNMRPLEDFAATIDAC